MGKQASRRHGVGVVGVGECTEWVSHSLSQSHSLSRLSTLCLTSLFSSSFFSFFYLGFFALSVTPFGADCCFFFFNILLGSWAPGLGGFMGLGLAGWWAGGPGGVHDILGGGPSKKLRGAQALFFCSLKILLAKNFFFWAQGGPGPPLGSTWVHP